MSKLSSKIVEVRFRFKFQRNIQIIFNLNIFNEFLISKNEIFHIQLTTKNLNFSFFKQKRKIFLIKKFYSFSASLSRTHITPRILENENSRIKFLMNNSPIIFYKTIPRD